MIANRSTHAPETDGLLSEPIDGLMPQKLMCELRTWGREAEPHFKCIPPGSPNGLRAAWEDCALGWGYQNNFGIWQAVWLLVWRAVAENYSEFLSVSWIQDKPAGQCGWWRARRSLGLYCPMWTELSAESGSAWCSTQHSQPMSLKW